MFANLNELTPRMNHMPFKVSRLYSFKEEANLRAFVPKMLHIKFSYKLAKLFLRDLNELKCVST